MWSTSSFTRSGSKISIQKYGRCTGHFYPGDTIGEQALLSKEKVHTTTLLAQQDCRLIEISEQDFMKMISLDEEDSKRNPVPQSTATSLTQEDGTPLTLLRPDSLNQPEQASNVSSPSPAPVAVAMAVASNVPSPTSRPTPAVTKVALANFLIRGYLDATYLKFARSNSDEDAPNDRIEDRSKRYTDDFQDLQMGNTPTYEFGMGPMGWSPMVQRR